MIVGLFPELLTKGGIQRIGQYVCLILEEMSENIGERCYLFSLNDPKGFHAAEVAGRRINVRGFGRNKWSFVRAVLATVRRRPLVYVAHPNLAPLGLVCKLLNPRVRYVVTAHGWEVWNPLPILCRLGLRYADALTAVSVSTAQKMSETQRVDHGKIVVIPNAVTEELLSSNGDTPPLRLHSGSKKVLLAVGRLAATERQKGFEEVILALPEAIKTEPDLIFIVVGEGDDKRRLEDLAHRNGVADRVFFAGLLTDEELIGLYKSCDVFVMPSKQEGFGIVFLEAMAFNKPVIGGNHGGTPEVILDGETGFLVEHGDVGALADRISRLVGDPALCQRMGAAGRRRVEENYTIELLQRKLTGLLMKVRGRESGH